MDATIHEYITQTEQLMCSEQIRIQIPNGSLHGCGASLFIVWGIEATESFR